MTSFVATLFLLRHWRQTRDPLFLLFAMSFALDAATRAVLGLGTPLRTSSPGLVGAPHYIRPDRCRHRSKELADGPQLMLALLCHTELRPLRLLFAPMVAVPDCLFLR